MVDHKKKDYLGCLKPCFSRDMFTHNPKQSVSREAFGTGNCLMKYSPVNPLTPLMHNYALPIKGTFLKFTKQFVKI